VSTKEKKSGKTVFKRSQLLREELTLGLDGSILWISSILWAQNSALRWFSSAICCCCIYKERKREM